MALIHHLMVIGLSILSFHSPAIVKTPIQPVMTCWQNGPARIYNPTVDGSSNTRRTCEIITPGERVPWSAH